MALWLKFISCRKTSWLLFVGLFALDLRWLVSLTRQPACQDSCIDPGHHSLNAAEALGAAHLEGVSPSAGALLLSASLGLPCWWSWGSAAPVDFTHLNPGRVTAIPSPAEPLHLSGDAICGNEP